MTRTYFSLFISFIFSLFVSLFYIPSLSLDFFLFLLLKFWSLFFLPECIFRGEQCCFAKRHFGLELHEKRTKKRKRSKCLQRAEKNLVKTTIWRETRTGIELGDNGFRVKLWSEKKREKARGARIVKTLNRNTREGRMRASRRGGNRWGEERKGEWEIKVQHWSQERKEEKKERREARKKKKGKKKKKREGKKRKNEKTGKDHWREATETYPSTQREQEQERKKNSLFFSEGNAQKVLKEEKKKMAKKYKIKKFSLHACVKNLQNMSGRNCNCPLCLCAVLPALRWSLLVRHRCRRHHRRRSRSRCRVSLLSSECMF